MKTPLVLLIASLPLLGACAPGVRLPSIHEPFSSPKWSRCAGELALRQTRTLLKDALLDSQAMLCRAAVSASAGKVEESVELFTEAGVRDKQDFRPHFLAGRVLAESGRYEESLTEYELAAKRNPSLAVPAVELGQQVLDKSGPQAAIDFLVKTKGRGLCEYECQGFLARLYQSQGRIDEAKALYGEMLKAQPEEPGAYVGLAALENVASKFHAEAEFLTQAQNAEHYASLAPTQQAEILYSLAFARYNAQEPNRAGDAITEALALDDSHATWYLLDGWIRLRNDDPRGATTAFHKARALDKSMAAAHIGLGDAYMLQGNAAEALVSFETAQKLGPTDAVITLKRAYATALLGNASEAGALLEQAARLDRDQLPAELVESLRGLLDEAGSNTPKP